MMSNAKKSWFETMFCYIWIFDVGRGMSAFIRTPLNQGIIVDCGGSADFSPVHFIWKNIVPRLDEYKGRKISQLLISHPHVDHFSEIDNPLFEKLNPFLLTCPHDKSKEESLNWDRIQNPEDSQELVDKYKNSYRAKKRQLPLQTILFDASRTVPNLEYGIYYIRPPICETIYEEDDLKYANSTSIMLYLRFGFHSILFPGDMPPEALKCLLAEDEGVEKRYTVFDKEQSAELNWHYETKLQPSLRKLLSTHGLSVLVAPHHGLESGFSEDLYDSIKGDKPDLVVISEKRHLRKEEGQIHSIYQSTDGSKGMNVNVEGDVKEDCKSFTTRSGHHILIVFETSHSWRVFAEKDPALLLQK